MATQNWAAWTSRGDVLTTELNSLAHNAYTGWNTVAGAVDNATNKDVYVGFLLTLANPLGLAPAVGATITIFIGPALDGTNWDDAPSATNAAHHLTGDGLILSVNASGTGARWVQTLKPVQIPPAKLKVCVLNQMGASAAMAATGNKLTMYTTNFTII